ncbi:hypothetical protein FRC08_009043 [Ceratobasidium sp. 394]|nr:hypothetical protein FRC08_009043 [Ceratobasidium sp. 394]
MSKLQTLELTYSDWEMATTRPELSPNSFPALATLIFNEIELLEIRFIWEHVPELFANLTKLECIFGPAIYDDEDHEAILSFPLRFTTVLNDKSPNITDLAIGFHFGDDYAQRGGVCFGEDTLRMLAKLPLQRLSVESAAIGPEHTDTEACKLLASTFPNLEVLRWTSQAATTQDLQAFADMPNLRHLSLYTISEEVSANVATEPPANVPLPKGQLRILETVLLRDPWLPVVRYIVCLWPNVQIVPLGMRGLHLPKKQKDRMDDRYKRINDFIASNRDGA